MAQNDWIATLMYNQPSSLEEVVANGLTPDNVNIKSEDYYKGLDEVQKAFSKDGKFDENAFNNFYVSAVNMYNKFAEQDWTNKLVDGLDKDEFDWTQPLKTNVKDKSVILTPKSYNPERRSMGITGIGKMGDPVFSIREIAQDNYVRDVDGTKLDWTPNQHAGLFRSIADPTLALAVYDENGTHEQNGVQVKHRKGDYKVDENGDFYYEKLGAKESYGRDVLRWTDTLTVDGSTLNKFDFMDSDGLDKSITSTILKTSAQLAPFLIPGVNTVAGAIGAFVGLASVAPTLTKAINNMTIGADTSGLTKTENFFAKFAPTQSDKGRQAGIISVEGIADVLSSSASQLYSQKVLGRLAYALGRGLGATENAAELGRKLSLGYMAITSSKDVYGDFKAAGASDVAAGIGMFATICATYGLMDSKYFREWLFKGTVLDESETIDVLNNLRKDEFKNLFSGNQIITTADKESNKALYNKVADAITKVWTKLKSSPLTGRAAQTASKGANKVRGTIGNYIARGLNEGVEETMEEGTADMVKALFAGANALGIPVKDKNAQELNFGFTPDNIVSRYGQAFLGGFMGGAVFEGLNQYENLFGPPIIKLSDITSRQQILYMLVTGKEAELKDRLKVLYQQGKLGNKNLSATEIVRSFNEDNKLKAQYFAKGTDDNNQNLYMYKAMSAYIDYMANIINNFGFNLMYEDSFIDPNHKKMAELGLLEKGKTWTNNERIVADFKSLTGLGEVEFLEYNKTNPLLKTIEHFKLDTSYITDVVNLADEVVKLEADIETLTRNTPAKTDEQKQQVAENNKKTASIKEMQQRLKELKERRDNLILGKNDDVYAHQALFITSKDIHRPFVSLITGDQKATSKEFYAERIYGKNYKDLNETQKQIVDQQFALDASDEMDNRKKAAAIHYILMENLSPELARVDKVLQPIGPNHYYDHNKILKNSESYKVYTENLKKRWDLANEITQLQTELDKIEKAELQNLINSDDYFTDLRGRDLNALNDDTLYLKEDAEAKLIDFITDEDYKAKHAQLNVDQQEMVNLDEKIKKFELYMDGHKNLLQENTTQAGIAELTVPIVDAYEHIDTLNKAIEKFDFNNNTITLYLKDPDRGDNETQSILNFQNSLSELIGEEVTMTNSLKTNEIWKEKLQKTLEANRFKPFDALVQYYKNLKVNQIVSDNDILLERTLKEFIAPIVNVNTFASVWEDIFDEEFSLPGLSEDQLDELKNDTEFRSTVYSYLNDIANGNLSVTPEAIQNALKKYTDNANAAQSVITDLLRGFDLIKFMNQIMELKKDIVPMETINMLRNFGLEVDKDVITVMELLKSEENRLVNKNDIDQYIINNSVYDAALRKIVGTDGKPGIIETFYALISPLMNGYSREINKFRKLAGKEELIEEISDNAREIISSDLSFIAQKAEALLSLSDENKTHLSSFHVNSEMKMKSEMIQGLFRVSDDGESIAEKLNKGKDTEFKIDLTDLWNKACKGVEFDNVTKQNMPAFNKAFFTFADSVYDEFHKANLSNEDIGKVIARGLDKDGYKLNIGKYSQDSEYVMPNLGNIDYLLIIGTIRLSDTYKALREVYAANEGIAQIFSQSWTILGNEAYLSGTKAFNYVNDCNHANIQNVDKSELKGDYGNDISVDYIEHLSKISNIRFVQGGPGTGKTLIDNLTKQLHDKLHSDVNYIAVAPHQTQTDNLKSLLKIKEDQCYTLDELFKIILDGDPELNIDAYHGAQYKQESIKFNKDVVSKLKLNKNTVFIIDEGTFISEGKLQVLSKLGDIFGIKCIISGDRKQNGEFALDPNGKTYSSTGVEDCVLSTAMELASTIRSENVAQLNNVEALGEKVDRGFRFYLKNRGTSSEKISEDEKILGGDSVKLIYSEGDDFFVGTKTIGSITDAKAYVNKFKKFAGDKTILIISDHKDDYKDLQGDKQILILDAHAAQGGEFDYVVVDKRFEGYRYDQFRDINTTLSRAKIGSVIVNKPELKNLINTDGPKDKSFATEPTTISSSIDQLTTWEKQNHDFLGEVKTSKPEKEETPKKDDGKTNPDGLTETQVRILDVLSSDFEDEGTQDEVITTVAADRITGSDDYKTEIDEEIEKKIQEERKNAKDVKNGQVRQLRAKALQHNNVVTAETLLADNKTFIDEIFNDKSELFKHESDKSNTMSIFQDMPFSIDYKKFINYFSSAVIANMKIENRHVEKIRFNTTISEDYIRKITDYWNSIGDQDRVFYAASLAPERSVLYLPVVIDGKQKLIPISTIESEVNGIIKVPKGNLLFNIASTVKAIKSGDDKITSIDSLPYGAVYSRTKILSVNEVTGEVGDGTGAYSVARNNQFAHGYPKGKTRKKKGANGKSFTVYSPIAILTDEDFEKVFKFRKVDGKNTYFINTDVDMDATVVSTDGSVDLEHKDEISYLRDRGYLTKADGTNGDELKFPIQLVNVQRVASLAQVYDIACIVKYANGNIPYEKLSQKQQRLIGKNNRVDALNYIQSILGEFSLDLGESSDTDEQNEISRSNFAKLRDKYRLMTKGASSNLLNALYLTFTDSSVQNGELQTKFEENLFRIIQTKAKARSGYGNISQTGLQVTFANGSAQKRYFVYYDSEDSCYKIKVGIGDDNFDENNIINTVESKGWRFGKQMDITFAKIIEAINNADKDPNAGYHHDFTTENLKWKRKSEANEGHTPISFELKTRVQKDNVVGYYTPSDYDYIFNSFRGMSISDFKALEKVFRRTGYFKKGIFLNDVGSTLEEGNCWKDLKVSSTTQNERTSNIIQYNPPIYKLNFEVIPGTIDDLYNALDGKEIETRIESNDEKISEFKKKVVTLLDNTIDDIDIDEDLIFPENFDSIYKDDGKESAIEAMQELLISNYHVRYDMDLNAMVSVNNNEDTDQEILNKISDMGFDVNSLQDLTNIKDDEGNITQVTFTYNGELQAFFIKEYNGQKELISANLNEIMNSLDLVVAGINDAQRAEILNRLETIILSIGSKNINEVIKNLRTFWEANQHILSINGRTALISIIDKFIAGRKDTSIKTSCKNY